MKKTLLVTGGAGFIGSHFVDFVLRKASQDWHILNLDKLTYAADQLFVQQHEKTPGYTFIKGDIGDAQLLKEIFEKYKIECVVHFAAESHVDNSISSPRLFLETNILGTHTLLEVARHAWLDAPHVRKKGFESARFHHVSTDEVYGSLSGEDPPFTETTPYAPNSPYSASKASSDFLLRAYAETYGLPVSLSNCSNNYGPRQHAEKLIPTIIRCALQNKALPIYGDGGNVRDWLYVGDHCQAIWEIISRAEEGSHYNIGGNAERDNLQVVKAICRELDRLRPRKGGGLYEELISFVKDRPGHDRRYAIDASKIKKELNWKPKQSFEEGLRETVQWYVHKYEL